MGALLYHQRYQDWNRDRWGAVDAGAARREEFTGVRLSPLGDELLAEIEHYLAFFALCKSTSEPERRREESLNVSPAHWS